MIAPAADFGVDAGGDDSPALLLTKAGVQTRRFRLPTSASRRGAGTDRRIWQRGPPPGRSRKPSSPGRDTTWTYVVPGSISAVPGCAVRRRTAARSPAQPGTGPPPPSIQGSPPRYARGAHGVEPRRVGKVAFSEWTADGSTRHPSWHGLRADKDPRQVHRDG